MRKHPIISVWLAVILPLAPGRARGCENPVFLHALQAWRVETPALFVFHHGALTEAARRHLQALAQVWAPDADRLAPSAGAVPALETADVDAPLSERAAAVWERVPWSGLPRLALTHPSRPLQPPRVAWTEALTENSAARFGHTGLRRQLAEELVAGASAVFLVLPGADAGRNQAAMQTLEAELPRIEQRVRLHWAREDRMTGKRSPELRFALRRFDDPHGDEVVLRAFLESLIPAPRADGPWVFPVFGRGRVLAPLPDDELPRHLQAACAFLMADCTCVIENDAPGSSFPLVFDWDEALKARGRARAPAPLPSLSPFQLPPCSGGLL